MSARTAWEAGEREAPRLVDVMRRTLNMTPGVRIDYVEVRDAETLAVADGCIARPVVTAIAAFVGATRLIDNQLLAP